MVFSVALAQTKCLVGDPFLIAQALVSRILITDFGYEGFQARKALGITLEPKLGCYLWITIGSSCAEAVRTVRSYSPSLNRAGSRGHC